MKTCRMISILTLLLSMIFQASVSSRVWAQEGRTIRAKSIPDTVTVTGNPASPDHIRYVISHYLEQAGYSTDALKTVDFGTLRPGESRTLRIPLVELSGGVSSPSAPADSVSDGDVPVSPEVPSAPPVSIPPAEFQSITVTNQQVPVISPVLLAFSNHPEKIKYPGLLFEVGAIRHKPVRLRYYHLGEEQSPPHYLGIFVENPGSQPVRMRVLEAIGGPSKDWLMAGHMSNIKYFRNMEKELGWVETIPPRSVHLLRRIHLKPGEVVSSTTDLHLLEGSPVRILVYAYEKEGDEITYPLKKDPKDPHERGAYPVTRIFTDTTFSLDEGEIFHTIGDAPFADIFKGKSIRGGYGIMYEYGITLRNPYDVDRTVSFYFQPRGGVATATFSFDGRPVSVGLTRAFQMARLARITVPANSSRTVNVMTMPEDASNYPVRFIMSTDPLGED